MGWQGPDHSARVTAAAELKRASDGLATAIRLALRDELTPEEWQRRRTEVLDALERWDAAKAASAGPL